MVGKKYTTNEERILMAALPSLRKEIRRRSRQDIYDVKLTNKIINGLEFNDGLGIRTCEGLFMLHNEGDMRHLTFAPSNPESIRELFTDKNSFAGLYKVYTKLFNLYLTLPC